MPCCEVAEPQVVCENSRCSVLFLRDVSLARTFGLDELDDHHFGRLQPSHVRVDLHQFLVQLLGPHDSPRITHVSTGHPSVPHTLTSNFRAEPTQWACTG